MRRLVLGACLVSLALGAAPAHAVAGPAWAVKAMWGDTNLPPGDKDIDTAEGQVMVQVRNTGDAPGAEEALVIEDKLPTGLSATHIYWSTSPDPNANTLAGAPSNFCTGLGANKVTCTLPAALVPALGPAPSADGLTSGYLPTLYIDVSVPAKAAGEGTNLATVKGGGAPAPASDEDQVPFGAPSPFGLVPGSFTAELFDAAHPAGAPTRKASERPFELRVDFDATAKSGVNDTEGDESRYITSNGQLRTVEATMPRGFLGNPEATPKCDPADFAEEGASAISTACPPDTQAGYINVAVAIGTHSYGRGGQMTNTNAFLNRVPIYNLEPPKGVPADLALNSALVQAHIYPNVDPAQDYAIEARSPNISNLVTVRSAQVTLWGVPADPAHDRFRAYSELQPGGEVFGAPWSSAPIRPFLTNPMDCGTGNGGARVQVDSYERPGSFTAVEEYPDPLNVTGCEDPRFRFEPDISLQPTSRDAGGPTGLNVHLEVPQRNDEANDAQDLYIQNGNVKAIATPPIKKTVVTFPEGMTLSPSAAQGLGSCSPEQIGLDTDSEVKCPDNSQYGTLTLHTPIFPQDAQPEGWIYIAQQKENPFGNFLALYLVIQEPERGILIKVPARLDLDPVTGQITTTFDDLPQFPVSDMQMAIKGGVRAGLVNPTTCGAKAIRAEFFSWQDPGTPHTVTSRYEVTEKPDGSPCVNSLAERPFAPQLRAETLNPIAGRFAPFFTRLTRTDDDQELSRLGLTLPAGLTAKFAGLGRCAEAGIAQAEARTGAGEGALEQADPSCPAAAEIGSIEAGLGVGLPLTYVPGKIYLAGPYRGAPLSVVAIVPAVVGPYDLGVTAVRSALSVNSQSAQGTATTDPFPQIYQGIPVRVRDIRLSLDRQEFMLNPTSCAPKQVQAHVTGTGGDVYSVADDTAADLANRFQVGECANLGFKPKLSFRLFGGTGRGAHPRLRAVLRGRAGDANIAGASVALPRSEFLDQAHIKTVCTRVQFAAKQCPPGSVYGHVKAKSALFDEAFSGPIYLRSSNNPLPDLVAALEGPASLPMQVDVVGRIDSVNGGIRNSFEVVPDVPVSWAVFSFQGAKKGLLVNSTDLCARAHRATAKFTGQNGKRITLRPKLRASCGNRKKARRAGHRRRF